MQAYRTWPTSRTKNGAIKLDWVVLVNAVCGCLRACVGLRVCGCVGARPCVRVRLMQTENPGTRDRRPRLLIHCETTHTIRLRTQTRARASSVRAGPYCVYTSQDNDMHSATTTSARVVLRLLLTEPFGADSESRVPVCVCASCTGI